MKARVLVVTLVLAACGADSSPPTTTPTATTASTTTIEPSQTTSPAPVTTLPPGVFGVELVADGFMQPVLVLARDGDDRLFVVDKPGVVWTLDGDERSVVLDISALTIQEGARGLLGVAFHPMHPERMILHYVSIEGEVLLAEYHFPIEATAANPEPVQILLTLPRPRAVLDDPVETLTNHDGGMIAFSPDGYLYVGLGDGGGSSDPSGQAQNPTTLWGSILRLDLDGGAPYAIPADNPFADGVSGAPEVWAWGLRNPWRFSFDGTDLWIGDVGQNHREEVDVISILTPGVNLGWPTLEGSRCRRGTPEACADPALVAPVYEYRHDNGGCAVVGGLMYRGSVVPQLTDRYVFGDFCTGEVKGLRLRRDGTIGVSRPGALVPGLTSFGVDAAGVLYVTAGSAVYRVVPNA